MAVIRRVARLQPPTLIDVARAAGVSLGSASRVVNAPHTVRPHTRTAVQAAIERLGYVPSIRGRALASSRSSIIGVVLPTISNTVYATFVHSLQRTLAIKGYALFVLSHEYDSGIEVECIRQLIGHGADGIVLIGTDHCPETLSLLGERGIPHILAWSIDAAPPENAIGIANRAAMKRIVTYLASIGHRRFAMLSGSPDHNERVRARVDGALEAAAEHGMELTALIEVPLTIAGGTTGYLEWSATADGATALVCVADVVAAGVLVAARNAGVSIPRALSITGFDDVEFAALLEPALTTVRVPIEEMGRTAGEAIVARIVDDRAIPTRELRTELIVRDSTGAPGGR